MKKIAVLMMIMIIGVLMLAGVCYAQEDAPQLYCEENGSFEWMSEDFYRLNEILDKYGIPVDRVIDDYELLLRSVMTAEVISEYEAAERIYEDNGAVIIHAGYDENIGRISFTNLQFSETYRLSISGVAEDGNKFYYAENVNLGNEYALDSCTMNIPISNKAGFYGPYDFELAGGGHILNYKVYFYVECDNPYEDAPNGILDEGIIMQPEFRKINPDESATDFVFPTEGAVLTGRPGYEIACTLRIPFISSLYANVRDEEPFEVGYEIELVECATGKVVASKSEKIEASIYLWIGDIECYIPVPDTFTHGGEYELRVQVDGGRYKGSVHFILLDETLMDETVSRDVNPPSGFGLLTDNGQIKIDLGDHDPEQPIICEIPDGQAYLFIYGMEGIARVQLSGIATNGEPFLYEDIFLAEDLKGFSISLSKYSGNYGPFTLDIIQGDQVFSYKLIFNIAESIPQEEWEYDYGRGEGIYKPFYADEGVCEVPEFIQWDPEYSFLNPMYGSVLSGEQGNAFDIEIAAAYAAYPNQILFKLRNIQTGKMISLGRTELDSSAIGFVGRKDVYVYNNVPILEEFEDGAWYDLIAYGVDDGIEYGSTRIRLVEERIKSEREWALSDDYTVCREDAIEIIQTAKNRFSEIPAKGGMIGYSIDAENAGAGVLNGFSVYTPAVDAEQVEKDLAYPDGAANWAVYDAYTLQRDGRSGDAALINMDDLNTLFGSAWAEIEVFEHAKGYAESEDGTYYYWIPVYYPDAEGSIYEDALGLFVYILREGVDTEYYAQRRYFAVYSGEYNVEKLFITDSAIVKEILTAMRGRGDALELTEGEADYETLSMDSAGTAVREVQTALVEKGFMTSSIDGYYGPMTEAAVIAYQQAMGLQATGVADAETQRMLLSRTDEKTILLDWLDRH